MRPTLLGLWGATTRANPTQPDPTRHAGASEGSWPLATFGSFFYRQYKTGGDCSKARALAGFLSWSQTNEVAQKIAYRLGLCVCVCVRVRVSELT